MDGQLKHIVPTLDQARLFGLSRGGFGKLGAVTCRREKPANASAGGADALGQIALGDEFELNLAAVVKAIKNVGVGLPGKAANDLSHPTRFEESSHAVLAVARVVVDHRQVPRTLLNQALNELTWDACGAKAPHQNGGTVLGALERLGDRICNLVDHVKTFSMLKMVAVAVAALPPWDLTPSLSPTSSATPATPVPDLTQTQGDFMGSNPI